MTIEVKLPQKFTPLRLASALIILVLGTASIRAATRISQFGITWSFDRDYPTGQFANGDYWVVGPVKITSITPGTLSTNSTVMNGSMINPTPNSAQGYDSRIQQNSFSASLNVASRMPLVVRAGSSLMSSESLPAKASGDNPQLKTIAILTVLSAPAPAGSFRPPYCGSDKTLRWNISQLDYSRLRSLPRVPRASSPSALAGKFARPWIEQKTNWTGRYMHPAANQPSYGREIAHLLGQGLLTLQLEYSNAEKEPLLIRLVQYGLDVYGVARLGARWNSDGGHNAGRKMPMLLAGTVLGDNSIMAYGDGGKFRIFQEDQQTWYVSKADVGRRLYTADGRPRVSYRVADIGLPEWGEKHQVDPTRDGRNWNTYYRAIAGSCTIGHILTAQLMGLQEKWNWPATFDYYDRYWSIEKQNVSRGANSIQPFVAEMWSGFRSALVAKFMENNIATDIWENTALKSQGGPFTIAFDLLASADKINSITGLSRGAVDDESDLATAVRFTPTGLLEAYDGGTSRAAKPFHYAAGIQYRVVMTVDLSAKRYSVSVTPPGGAATLIADGWKFHSNAAQLDNLGFRSASGYHAVLNLGVAANASFNNAALIDVDTEDEALELSVDAANELWNVKG